MVKGDAEMSFMTPLAMMSLVAGGATGFALSSMSQKSEPQATYTPPASTPEPSQAEEIALERTRNESLRRRLYGRTLLTSPLGTEEPETEAKTLLGA